MDKENKIKKIKTSYEVKEDNVYKGFDELKALDSKVKKPANVFAYVYGIVGALILGVGMTLAMNVIGGTTFWMIAGIVIGLVGIAMVSSTYYIYTKILAKRKDQYRDQVIELSNNLLNK